MDIDIDSEPIASSSETLLDDHVPLFATHCGTATDVLNSLCPSDAEVQFSNCSSNLNWQN